MSQILLAVSPYRTLRAFSVSSVQPKRSAHIPTLQLFNSVQHNHATLHIALHGNLIHFCCADLLFRCIEAAPHDRLPFANKIVNTTFQCKRTVLSCTHTHPSDGNIYKYKPCGFRLHNPLAVLLYFWPEVHNYESTHKDPT